MCEGAAMSRFIPLILTLAIAGCGHVNAANFPAKAMKEKPRAVAMAAKPAPHPNEEPEPPVVVPTPPVPIFELAGKDPEGEVDDWILVEIKTNGQEVKFIPIDKRLKLWPSRATLDSPFITYVRATVGGEFPLLAMTTINGKMSDPLRIMVTVHGPQPPPVPIPPPGPTPQPTPPVPPVPPPAPVVVTSPTLWIVTLDDWQTRTPALVQMLMGDIAMWEGFKAQGHQFEKIDKSNTAQVARFQKFIDAAGGLPVVLFMAPDGTVLNKGMPADMRLPQTSAEMRRLVSKYSGK